LFRKGVGFLGTELFHNETNPRRWLIIDRWKSREYYEGFLSRWNMEYHALDVQCEGLTESESCIGKFQMIHNA
jgi:quinol monooxygenase YgiN